MAYRFFNLAKGHNIRRTWLMDFSISPGTKILDVHDLRIFQSCRWLKYLNYFELKDAAWLCNAIHIHENSIIFQINCF